MKFKAIFVIFNIFILFTLLMLLFIPIIILDAAYSKIFWQGTWYISALFILFVTALDFYFIKNWKLFTLLEEEKWPALIRFLEGEIYSKKHFSKKNISLLINAYVAVSNFDKIKKLEVEIRAQKSALLPYFALYLGFPYFVEKEMTKCVDYYGEFKDNPQVRSLEWVQWCYAFGLISQNKISEAGDILFSILKTTKNNVLKLLILYLVGTQNSKFSEERHKLIEIKTEEFTSVCSNKVRWNRIFNKEAGDNILAILLSALIRKAYEWITRE